MKIVISSDHAGYKLKSLLIEEFKNSTYQFIDYGCDNSETSVDYPDVANKLCQQLVDVAVDFGILICGSGVGVSIAANRFKEIRAALCHNEEVAKLSRQHNDANVLCMGARIIDEKTAIECVNSFLSTNFERGRHVSRVLKLSR